MHLKSVIRFFLLMIMIICIKPACARKIETGFLNRAVTVNGAKYCYQAYVPADYTPKKKWPVILFLHGAGERGEDCELQTKVGIGSAIRRDTTNFPCIVVLPQCRRGAVWFGDKEKPYETIAKKIGKTPVWIFHGDADQSIPVSESRQMHAALQALGGNVKYTEYPGVGHNSWDKAYAEPGFLSWLLAQRLAR